MFPVDPGSGASQALRAAALSGLLCVASACSMASSGSTASVSNADTPVPANACASGVSPHPQVSSSTVAAVAQDQFEADCAARSGIFEIQPGCGGSNSCRGLSYDAGTTTLTEHSCRGTNTCAGYSCVICG